MLTIMHQYTNYIVALLVGIWTIVGAIYSQNQELIRLSIDANQIFKITISSSNAFSWYVILAINLSILLLLFWRYYVHSLDNAIAKNYPRLVYYEHILLGCPEQVGVNTILHYLVEKFPAGQKSNDWNTQYIKLCNLEKQKKLGYRSHNIFDIVAYSAIVALSLLEAIVLKIDETMLIISLFLLVVDSLILCQFLDEKKLTLLEDFPFNRLKWAILISFVVICIQLIFSIQFRKFDLTFLSIFSLDIFYILLIFWIYFFETQHNPTDTDI